MPKSFASDAERMARFEREAQVLAPLNHPSIAAIYGLEESGGARAIARQIADAFEYAHDRCIIHRDLKPVNVKVTTDGTREGPRRPSTRATARSRSPPSSILG